jgi:enoyl-CoA hydratase/carnithine racemase
MSGLALPVMETLLLERTPPVAHLVLNRPEQRNAMSSRMWEELAALGRAIGADEEIRVLIVRGAGPSFCAGADLDVLRGRAGALGALIADPATSDEAYLDCLAETYDAYRWLRGAPFTTIAAIHGFALGGGLELALACDLRIAGESAQLGLPEVRLGVIPDMGATALLPRLVGEARAKELHLLCVNVGAVEAERIGLVNRVVPDAELLDICEVIAERIAALPPLAMRAARQAIDGAATLPLDDAVRLAARLQLACFRSADRDEALAAFTEQRAGVYRGR